MRPERKHSFQSKREQTKLWRRFGQRSLTVKLVGAVSAVVFIVVVIGTVILVDVTRREIAETSIATALYQTQFLKSKLFEAFVQGNPTTQDLDQILTDLEKSSGPNQASIFDESGQIVSSTMPDQIGKLVTPSPGKPDRVTPDGAVVTFMGKGKTGVLRIVHPIVEKSSGQSVGGIELLVPLAPIYQRFGINNFLVAGLAFLSIILIAFLIHWLVYRIVKRPLNKLVHVMERAKKGELDVRTNIREDPELRRLAKAFNLMVQGIRNAQKRIQAQHQKELSQSNRLASLGQFISNVSHEIKNPLTAISSTLHVLRDQFKSSDDQLIFQELTKQIERIERTVNNLLRYAKQAPPTFERCYILDPIHYALKAVESRDRASKVVVRIERHTDKVMVEADEGQLEQVFLNLFLNAIDSMKEGGVLRIHLREVFERAQEWDEASEKVSGLSLTVEDTGSGIEPGNLERIFQPFFTTKKGGTGLGLSVVKGIVEAHGGKIRIESSLSKGTSVHLYLPFLNRDKSLLMGRPVLSGASLKGVSV